MPAMATATPEVPLRCESDMHLQRDLEILKSISASFSKQKPHDNHRHPRPISPRLWTGSDILTHHYPLMTRRV